MIQLATKLHRVQAQGTRIRHQRQPPKIEPAVVHYTPLLDRVLKAPTRIVVQEGSTRSGKTFAYMQALFILSQHERGKLYSVARATMPALKRGALRDWKAVLSQTVPEAYSLFDYNKTDQIYTNRKTGTQIEFIAFDGPQGEQRSRGPTRDRLHLNEANELSHDVYKQLAQRTRESIWLGYNPSMQRSWIYSDILTRPDCTYIHSTYKDNPFLSAGVIVEIEGNVPMYQERGGKTVTDWDGTYKGKGRLIKGNPYWWAVYGLGQRGAPGEAIFPIVHTLHAPGHYQSIGLDFGYRHPMVMARVGVRDVAPKPELHIDELLHARNMTIADLIEMMPQLGVGRKERIYADSSRPEAIEEIKRAGYNIVSAKKGPGSVWAGIQAMQRYKLMFTPRSQAGRAQFENYRSKKSAQGLILEEPIKLDDDCPDAVRYGIEPFRVPRKRTTFGKA